MCMLKTAAWLTVAWSAISAVVMSAKIIGDRKQHSTHVNHSQRCTCFASCYFCLVAAAKQGCASPASAD